MAAHKTKQQGWELLKKSKSDLVLASVVQFTKKANAVSECQDFFRYHYNDPQPSNWLS